MTGTSLEEASYKDPPAVERNYFEQDPQTSESTKHHSPESRKTSLGRSRRTVTMFVSPLSPATVGLMLLGTSASPHGCQGQGATSRSHVPPADTCWSRHVATVTCRRGGRGSLLLEHGKMLQTELRGPRPLLPACMLSSSLKPGGVVRQARGLSFTGDGGRPRWALCPEPPVAKANRFCEGGGRDWL